MRRLIVSNVMSLDGFFEDTEQKIDWFPRDEEFFAYARAMLRSVDTILFGRTTWLMMAAYWPSAPTDEIAEKMNGLAKIVFSSTLTAAEWNRTTLLREDPVREVSRLKQSAGGDMVVLGSGALASSLLAAGLVDEYRVIVDSVVLGNGTPLFQNIPVRIRLRLASVQRLASGVVILTYKKQ
jgi:dihydrofolate reductase